MPTVLRIEGFRFYFYSHEPNEPPHVHIDRGNSSQSCGCTMAASPVISGIMGENWRSWSSLCANTKQL
jgi:hypothetical protein